MMHTMLKIEVEHLKKWTVCLALTHFKLMFLFYTPWEHKKPRGCMMFSGGMVMEHWFEIG